MGKLTHNPVGGLIRKAQDQLEQRAGSLTGNDSVLQQDRVWLKAVTWGLIGTTAFGIGWLAIARTEEVVVAQGQLKPSGGVKEIRIPTLVVHGTADIVVPYQQGQASAIRIPDADFLSIEGGTHLSFISHHEQIEQKLVEFLHKHAPID